MSATTVSTGSAPVGQKEKKKSFFTGFGAQVIIGLVVGVVLGLVGARGGDSTAWIVTALGGIGSAYVTLLKLLIPPLVVTAVVTSIANLRQVQGAARLAGQTLVWFAVTAFVSVIAGIAVGLILNPGKGAGVDASTAQDVGFVGSWWAFIESIIPSNILGLEISARSSGDSITARPGFNVLQLLVLSIAFGIAAVQSGKKAQPVIDFAESLLAIVQKVLWWIIRLAPIGTAGLIGRAVATYGWDAIGSLGKFVLAIYIGLAIVLAVIYPAVLKLNGLPVRHFYRKIWPVTSLGFVTRSSMGTMPVTERTTEKALGVPRSYASFAVPLGATTKMDGCAAIYPAIAAIFVSGFYGVPLSPVDYLLIIFVSVIGSAATAGTTGATVMLTLTLSTLGLPLEGVGLLLAVEPIVDMGRTAVNVTGQALVPLIVAKREGILDESVFVSEAGADTADWDDEAGDGNNAAAAGADNDELIFAGGAAGHTDRGSSSGSGYAEVASR
ncbi:dicarboxylate/amino acid:cation symporter [Corynebacterium mendelii]|uniref:Dicarboxylate/amino acid:cation symporter n=1 Tax=Corynebacterium mendelii TaxID=2765362 RepID=A0A939IY33_9CORY|nr:dicarboxylate/amino acid:cation symporter [Corynebacterium mendelii]MBN9644257.1 dicarboxylate/amino acid:cation symporter [Corynebacterium mendelii]